MANTYPMKERQNSRNNNKNIVGALAIGNILTCNVLFMGLVFR